MVALPAEHDSGSTDGKGADEPDRSPGSNGSNGTRSHRDGASEPAQVHAAALPELELTYPCTWGYTVITEREEPALREAVAGVVGALEHRFQPSRKSSGGRYLSFRLEVVVRTDEERLRIFRELHEHEVVRYVL